MIKLILLFTYILYSRSYNLCVVGASGGLGKELIYQAITERNLKVLGLTSKPYNIDVPYRGNGYENVKVMPEFISKNLTLHNYWDNLNYNYQHIIFCSGASCFERDYSDFLTKKILMNLSENCSSISLVSAYGVDDNYSELNIGIRILKNTMLKDSYIAKKNQEKIIEKYHKKINKYIYRPKALSYGLAFFESVSRYDLAEEILNKIV